MECIKPSSAYLNSYYEGCRESYADAPHNYIIHDPDKFDEWKDTVIEDFENHANGINLPEGFLPNVTFWCVENGEYIGTINIRPELNDFLRNFGGHMGIFVRKSARGKGYGTKLAMCAVREARKIVKDDLVYVTALAENEAAVKCLESMAAIDPKMKIYKTERDRVMFEGKMQDIVRMWFDK